MLIVADKKKIQVEIKKILHELKSTRGIVIPLVKSPYLERLFNECGGLTATFDGGSSLSGMETLVIALFLLSLNDDEIANTLSISSNTVRSHMNRVKQKFHVSKKLDAIIAVLRKGIIKINY